MTRAQPAERWRRTRTSGARLEILLGPYGSRIVRRVAPVVCQAAQLLWNHGGAADDLAMPGLATVVAPASTYLRPLVELSHAAGLDEVAIAMGCGPLPSRWRTGAAGPLTHWDHGPGPGQAANLAEATPPGNTRELARALLVVAGTFDEDVAAVRRVRETRVEVGVLGSVAAGIDEFGHRLGRLAGGVIGPAQWWCRDEAAAVGPSGPEFEHRFERRFGHPSDYLAA